jgi:methyl-accepting chemotaxis protein
MTAQDIDPHRGRILRSWRVEDAGLAPDRRIWAAGAGFLALLVVGVLISTFLMARLGDDAEDLAQRQVQYSTALSGAALNAKGIANDERGYLLSGNNEFLIEIDIRTGLARDYFDQAAEAADDAQSRRILQAYDAFERWLVALEDELAMFREGDREAARAASLGPTRQLRKEYEALLGTATLSESGVPNATASVSASASRSVTILIAYLVAAIIIGYIAIVWAARGLHPTRSLGSAGTWTGEGQGRRSVPG